MLNKFLFWISGKLPLRKINLDSGPYLERYFLGQLFGITFYLHRFVSSDSELHMHNHAWRWGGSLILAGSYIEERALDICPTAGPAGCLTERRRRRWFNRVNGSTIHRIHDAEPGTWTLFFHGERVMFLSGEHGRLVEPKGWGFFRRSWSFELARGDSDNPPENGKPFTEFVPYPKNYGNWWETAPVGAEAGRVPL